MRMRQVGWVKRSETQHSHSQKSSLLGFRSSTQPTTIITAIIEGNIVRYQQQDRPIYEVSFNGRRQLIAVTVANNGYIVCANPSSL